jgi:Na+-driven multidrug efflux pump
MVLGAVELAAHQISINFFLFFCIFGDVISQISQTYLPYFLADINSPSQSLPNISSPTTECAAPSNAISPRVTNITTSSAIANYKRAASIEGFKATISKACTLGAFFGIFNCAVCLALDRFAYGFITSSLEVRRTLSSVSPLLMLSVLPHCLMLALEGQIHLLFLTLVCVM